MTDQTGADAGAFADDKDWTWVLERTCSECQFDVRHFVREDVGDLIRANAAGWVGVLARDDQWVRQRTSPTTWSPLEYAFHVRDVYELYHERLDLMLTEDGPSYPNWDQDEAAVAKDYSSADPARVASELVEQAEALAARFDTVSGHGWARTGFRSDGAEFTVESFARYLIHDPVHHLWDVRQ